MEENILRKLEGLHTIETVAEELGITRQSALNLLCRLKKQQHVTTSGGGRQKRLYKITMRKQRPRDPGMFDIINKYSPHMKLVPDFDHQVHGRYGPEEALIDAIETKRARVIMLSMRLFGHITDWHRVYTLAKKKGYWVKIRALYDIARLFFRVRRMPENLQEPVVERWDTLTQLKKKNFPEISEKWKIYIPFNKYDLREA